MSDFARPPRKPPRAGKSTFGQTNGLHPLVERRMYDRITCKKSEEKEKEKENENENDVRRNSGTRETLEASEYFCFGASFPNCQKSNQDVSFF